MIVFFGDRHTVKLGDFGLSKLMQSHDFASTYVGTPYYMSPEICAAESYTSHSDIWSVGCIIYELCTKRPPFDAKTHFHLISKIKEGRYEPLPAMYSPELQAMIKSCLNTNPLRRPRTADLMNMPVVRLARKQAEVVELGATLQIKIKETDEMKKQADAVVANKDREQETYRHFMDDKLRREWEVKARLEIDRQVGLEVERQVTNKVQAELERLQKTYQTEVSAAVAARVQEEVAKHSASLQSSFSVPELSSQMTNATNDTAPTDISSLSFESPIPVPTTKEAPIKKSSRTPFSRARTQVDSPMDVQMISPSPMSIASLSLSPRRATALAQGLPTNNIFGAARNKDGDRGRRDRWQPQQLETLSSDDEDETNFLPDLSPTRPPRAAVADPFKAPRPAFKRQSTMPVKPTLPSNIFSDNHSRGKEPTKPSGIPTSPTRATRPARPFTKAHTTAGGEEMLKAVTQKNMMEGRTLVELAQAKAATVGEGSGYKSGTDNEGSSWQDDDDEEIPSPFLVRTRRPVVGFGR